MLWLFRHTRKFPREERFRLAARIELVTFTFHESLTYAAKTKELEKYLNKADAELAMLRSYLRFTLELKYSTPKQYHYAAQLMNELDKLLGTWLKQA